MYKKMALELHPDKGGDPEKFQELQEMKERMSSSLILPEHAVTCLLSAQLCSAGASHGLGKGRG